jgi:hypothetical protein
MSTIQSAFLTKVCTTIRLGRLDEAEAMVASHDAPSLNLLGVIHEIRGEWKLARKYYGKAIRTDQRFEPAQQNMRRFYELHTFGHSREPVALGDETPAAAWVRAAYDHAHGHR